MKIRLEQILSTPQGLVMGVQIRGPKDSWIRFGVLEVPWAEVPVYICEDYTKWRKITHEEALLQTALPFDL